MKHATRLKYLAGLVLLVGISIYLQGLSGPLFFDDKPALTGNRAVQIHGSNFDEWRVAALSSSSGPLRRPIAMLSFALNHALGGGFSSFQLKSVNLFIHLATAILFFYLAVAILNCLAVGSGRSIRNIIAITAAAIWLLHPLHVSTVLYAVQRMAQLATLFVTLGLLIFMHYRLRWARSGASAGEFLAGTLWLLLLTALAALSKENGLLLPWLVIVLEVGIFHGAWKGRSNSTLQSIGWVLLVLPVLVVILALVISPDLITGGFERREFTLGERLLTQGRMLWHYLGWICLPNISDMGFQHDDIALSTGLFAPMSTFVALLAWIVCLTLAFVFRQRFPLFFLAVLFYLVSHSMESTVIPLEMVYEHRNYLPSMLICLALASLLIIPASKSQRIGIWYPMFGVLAILGTLLFVRVQIWSDELSLFAADVANHPESSRSNYFYANALVRRFRQREELALSEEQGAELLLLSRHYFERMYQTNERDMAALVMLYYLDSQYFPELEVETDWLSKLEPLLLTKKFQASDWSALDTLLGCFASGACKAGDDRVLGILDLLGSRYPGSARVARYRYRYFSALGAEPERLLPLLRQAQEDAPVGPWAYYYLMYEFARVQDSASMYEYAGKWLLNDRHRYDFHLVKELFSESAIANGKLND